MTDATALLQVTQLSCIRQHTPVFANISFELTAGEALIVEGANGSGKSSLLRLLTGLSTPASGDIYWQQQSIQPQRADYAAQLHYVGHTNGLKLGLTIAENIALMQHLAGAVDSQQKQVSDVIESLQLSRYLSTQAAYLSAGQKRRLALMKLFLLPKKLWIVDEPLTALDVATQTYFLAQLQQHLYQGGLCVLSSHHPIALTQASVKTLRLSNTNEGPL